MFVSAAPFFYAAFICLACAEPRQREGKKSESRARQAINRFAQFSAIFLTGAAGGPIMVGMKILSPEFPSPLTRYENNAPVLENFTENAAFSACDFTRAALADAEFSHVKFSGCKFVSADLRRADFCDAVFENCDFSGAILRGAALRRARLEGCKGMGADFSEGYFADTVAGKCNFSYANFGCKLQFFRLLPFRLHAERFGNTGIESFARGTVRHAVQGR